MNTKIVSEVKVKMASSEFICYFIRFLTVDSRFEMSDEELFNRENNQQNNLMFQHSGLSEMNEGRSADHPGVFTCCLTFRW